MLTCLLIIPYGMNKLFLEIYIYVNMYTCKHLITIRKKRGHVLEREQEGEYGSIEKRNKG